jgi:hypothetical protein
MLYPYVVGSFTTLLPVVSRLTLYPLEVLFLNSFYPHLIAIKTKQNNKNKFGPLFLSHARYHQPSPETLTPSSNRPSLTTHGFKIDKLLNENQISEEPKVGMMFNSEEDVRAYFTCYAKQKGFGVSRRTSKPRDDGKSVRYSTLSCVCQGKAKSRAANPLKPQPKQNLECKAKINASRCFDGRFMLSNVVSITIL